jgi:hypothetical protein
VSWEVKRRKPSATVVAQASACSAPGELPLPALVVARIRIARWVRWWRRSSSRRFLGGARHDRDGEGLDHQVAAVHRRQLLGKERRALGDRSMHLLRRLRRRDVRQQVGPIDLEVVDPARAAAREERERALPFTRSISSFASCTDAAKQEGGDGMGVGGVAALHVVRREKMDAHGRRGAARARTLARQRASMIVRSAEKFVSKT